MPAEMFHSARVGKSCPNHVICTLYILTGHHSHWTSDIMCLSGLRVLLGLCVETKYF